MNQEIRVLDVVALTEDITDRGLLRGQVGTVVESRESDFEEVIEKWSGERDLNPRPSPWQDLVTSDE